MEILNIYQLRSMANAYHRNLSATPDVDKFCASLDWILPAHEAFIPDHPLLLAHSDAGFVPMARGFNPRIGRYLQPLEASWCLASPFVGPDPQALITAYRDFLARDQPNWDLLYLSGIPVGSRQYRGVLRAFGDHRIGTGHITRRFMASLEGGYDGFLGRRSAKFRANLRRTTRKAADVGVTFEIVNVTDDAEAGAIYERILNVEERSWKGMEGTGILDGGMNTFYRIMIPRLIRRGAFRVAFARLGGRDIATIFGGIFDTTYRGLQVSYDNEYRSLSLGNLMQREIIRALCEEGILKYDLGSELEYKAKWAEERLESTTIWVWKERY